MNVRPTKLGKKVRRKQARSDELFPQIQRWSARDKNEVGEKPTAYTDDTPVQLSPDKQPGPGKKSLG
jgi:hypothetical protein